MKNLKDIKKKIEKSNPELWNDLKMHTFNVLEEGFKILEDEKISKKKYLRYYKNFENKREEIKEKLGIDLKIEPYDFLELD